MVIHTTTGIATVIGHSGIARTDVVRRMLARLAHRGPDLSDILRRDSEGIDAAFGYVGLVASPDALADWRAPDDIGEGPIMVMDGFIMKAAGAPGIRTLEPRSSQKVTSLLESLDGHFALVHYDPTQRRLMMARDPLGVKPLYWARCRGDDGIVVASEIRAVLASGLVDPEYDAAGIASYLAYGNSHAPQTIYRSIYALPPGCWLEAHFDGQRILAGSPTPYWRPQKVTPPFDANSAIERLRDALGQAVAGMSAGLPAMSTFLPGDVESAVLALMAGRSVPGLRTAFVDLESEGLEERARLAAAVAEELRARHFQMIVDDEWGCSLWMDWLTAADNPCVDGYDTYVVSQAIKDSGAVAAIYPAGGSELLRGNPFFAMTTRLVEIASVLKKTPRWLKAAVKTRMVRASSPMYRELVNDACEDDATPLSIALHARRMFHNADLRQLGFDAESTGLGNTFLPPAVRAALPMPTGDLFSDLMHLQCLLGLPNRTLAACDTGSMANSLELRLPYATRSVAECLLAMPGRLLSPKPSRSGAAIRNVASGMLPYNLLVRQEPRPQYQFSAWMTGPLREFVGQCVNAAASCPVVDGDALLTTWRRIIDGSSVADARLALTLVSLGALMRQRRRENLT